MCNPAATGKSSKLGGGKSKETVQFVLPEEEEFDENFQKVNGYRDNGIVIGDDRDEGKPHEESEHITKCLPELKVKEGVV